MDLPPPENASITLVIKDPAGDGASGQVYYVDVVDSTAEGYIPPLVVKVARPNRLGHIAREAWFYDELAVLQGVCIPRCYGWFEAELPEGCFVPEEALELEDDIKHDFLSDDPDQVKGWGRAVQKRSKLRTRVSLLLLERVGREITPGESIPITAKYVSSQAHRPSDQPSPIAGMIGLTWPMIYATFMSTIVISSIPTSSGLLQGHLPSQVSRLPELGRYIHGG